MWVVGIDEAGYGPNLGPLVQAAVGLRLPDADPAGWDTLKPAVRRCHEKTDARLLVDDSKKVYTRHGLPGLERTVWATTAAVPHTVHEFLWGEGPVPAWGEDLLREAWFDPAEVLPADRDPAALAEAFAGWHGPTGGCAADARVVPAARFNTVCDANGSKGAVLAHGVVDLLAATAESLTGDEPLAFYCDKLGGRNYYAALVQQAFPDGWVVAERESAAESRYRVEHLSRPMTVTFRPRADGDSVSVALASMLCKYLREVCMRQFNRFWAAHVPGIAPTAGYPVDATRFYAQIRPAMERLGLTADQVWRKK